MRIQRKMLSHLLHQVDLNMKQAKADAAKKQVEFIQIPKFVLLTLQQIISLQ